MERLNPQIVHKSSLQLQTMEQQIARRKMYMAEIDEKGLNNFNADMHGGYRRLELQDDREMLERRNPDKRMGKCILEYWEDIDSATNKLGIEESIIAIRQQMQRGDCNREELQKQLNALLVPLYVELREQGYSQLDLWS
ncbi:MAG: hypothetical protein NTV98_01870 [Candidatus Roizmanbacteria bacterium]|nr:hypothetical protein [Candidatus Roizmanbacteria bacterium]